MTPRAPRLMALGLVLAVVGVYWNSLRAPFIFDDAGAVVNNPTIRRLASLDVLRPPADGSTTTGRPIVNLSFAVNHVLGGANVVGYHLGNVGLHAMAALLLLGIVRRTLLRCGMTEPLAANRAFAAALLWAVHPLQTESVVCVAQRTEVLCGVFILATLYTFLRGCDQRDEPGARSGRRWFGMSLAASLLGMATKEVAVTAPVLVWLYDRTFVAGTFGAALRTRAAYYVGLAAGWLLLAALLLQSGGARGASAGFGLGITPWTYLLRQAEALGLYLKLSVWPYPLVLDYGTSVISSAAEAAGPGFIILGLLAATVVALVRRPRIGFLGASAFLILAPSSSVVPLVTQTVAEHRMYLPLAALVAGAVLALERLRLRGSVGVLAGAIVACAVLTMGRNGDYASEEAIWADTVAKAPLNARAHNNLAQVLQQQGRLEAADRSFAQAVALQPNYVSARYNWGVALLAQGRFPEATVQLATAVRLAPNHADAYLNLGVAQVRAGRVGDGIESLQQALRLGARADVHYNLGIALLEQERKSEAVAHFQAAITLDRSLLDARYQLGRLAEAERRASEAEAIYRDVVSRDPDHAAAQLRLGLLLARAERLEEAGGHLRAAIRARPQDADAHANLGNVLLLQGRAREALGSYEEALRLRPGDARLRESVALAREASR